MTTSGFQLPSFGAAKHPALAASTTTTTIPAKQGLFGPTPPTTSTTAPTPAGFPGFASAGTATATATANNVQQTAPTSTIGLGGLAAPAGSAALSAQGASSSLTGVDSKPKEGKVEQELIGLVEDLKKRLKANKDLSDQLATTSVDNIRNVAGEVKDATKDLQRLNTVAQKLNVKSSVLSEEARNDLRQAEMVQRRQETIPVHAVSINAQPVNYLHGLVDCYENLLVTYTEQLNALENFIASRASDDGSVSSGSGGVSEEQILQRLRQMEQVFQHTASKAYHVHGMVEDVKAAYLLYRRQLYGDSAGDPFAEKSKTAIPSKISGPDPFSAPSQSILIDVAQSFAGKSGAGAAQQPAGFGAGASSLFSNPSKPGYAGFGSISNPAANTSSLFKPFGTTAAVSSAAPTFGGFGSTATSTAVSQAPTLNFGSTYNSSSGTLFGGSAATKPLFGAK